jgi:hypothetical protein
MTDSYEDILRVPVMGYQPLPQKQLFTVGQIVAAISIVACLVFIVSYSGRIILDKKVQADQERLQQEVVETQTFYGTIQEMLNSVDSPAVVEPYARGLRNMELPGEQSVAPLIMKTDSTEQVEQADATDITLSDEEAITNWQLWLDFVMAGGDQ